MSFPTAPQVNLLVCSPHYSFNAERQVGIEAVIRLGMIPKSTTPETDALTTRPSELLYFHLDHFTVEKLHWLCKKAVNVIRHDQRQVPYSTKVILTVKQRWAFRNLMRKAQLVQLTQLRNLQCALTYYFWPLRNLRCALKKPDDACALLRCELKNNIIDCTLLRCVLNK